MGDTYQESKRPIADIVQLLELQLQESYKQTEEQIKGDTAIQRRIDYLISDLNADWQRLYKQRATAHEEVFALLRKIERWGRIIAVCVELIVLPILLGVAYLAVRFAIWANS